MKRLVRIKLVMVMFFLFLGCVQINARAHNLTVDQLPKIWHITWPDKMTQDNLHYLKSIGIDGIFKCVGAANWSLVEKVEGTYNWSALETCLNSSYQANIWFIPEVVINIPPDWFIARFPDSLLKDARGYTATDPIETGAPYLLSPWFIASGQADTYIEPLVNSFLDLVSRYPNVPAIMIGNFKLNVLPKKMVNNDKDNDEFNYWPLRDAYAISSYQDSFGSGALPPADWAAYESMNTSQKTAFKKWIITAMNENLQHRFLPWLSSFEGFHVINVCIWDSDDVRGSTFTTQTESMITSKQQAILASGVNRVIINDDNMGDTGLASMQQKDINLAHGNGFLIYGERVPNISNWEDLYDMWAGFDPRPDGFINIVEETIDPYWLGMFRSLYGEATEPLIKKFLPLLLK